MASKINPLFQDSTISSGTNIRTQFELKKVLLNDGEKLFLALIDNYEKKYIELKCLDSKTGTYSCSVWLKHKQDIGYSFFIKSEHEIIAVSEQKKGVAMYTVLETWLPLTEPELLLEVTKEIALTPQSSFVEEADNTNNTTGEDFIENLIEKWGL